MNILKVLPITDLLRSPNQAFEELNAEGVLTIFKNNRPTAILLSVERYDSLLEELEDYRVERLAIDRLAKPSSKTISHEEMKQEFD